MLSPGSSKAASCAANSLVTISKVIRCTLARAEKILYSTKIQIDSSSINPQLKMLQARSIFQRKIFEARILLSRLLVLLRWSKTMHMARNDSIVNNLFSGPEIHVQKTFYEINQYVSKSRLKSFQDTILASNQTQTPENDFQMQKNSILRLHQQFFDLFMKGVPKRIKSISKIGKHLVFVAPGEYSFILKSDKHGNLQLSSFRINVPKDFHFSKEMIISHTKLLVISTNQINMALARIDRVLHSFYLYCEFAKLVKSLCDNQANYPICCEGSTSIPPSIKIVFPPLFGSLSSFRLSIQMGKLIVSSVGTIYLPPASEDDSLYPLDTFIRVGQTYDTNVSDVSNSSDSCTACNKPTNAQILNHHQLSFVLKKDFGPPDVLLSFIRDTVLYTKLVKIWNTAIHAIRSVSFSYFDSHMIYNSKMSTFGRIEISLKKSNIITVSIDAWTGVIKLCFCDQANMGLPGMTFSCIEPEEISGLMSKVLTNFTVHKAVETVYGVKVPSNVFLKDPKLYSRYFSFAPDFSLHFHTDFGHPHVSIYDNYYNQYTSPDIVEMDSSTPISAWKLLERTLQSSKSLIFLLQTQKSLQESGIQSVRTGLMLDIILPMCRSCSLVINNHGWRLLYSHFNTFGRIKVPDLANSNKADGSNDFDVESLLMSNSISDLDDKAISEAINDYSSSQIELSTVIRGYSNLARSAQIVAQIITKLHQSRSNFFNIIMLSRRTMAIEPPYLSNSNEMILRFQNDAKNTLCLTFGKNMKYCGTCHEISFFEMNPTSIPEFQIRFLSLTPIQWMINSAIPNSNDSFALSSFINHSAIPFLKFFEIFANDKNKIINSNDMVSDNSYAIDNTSNRFVIMPLINTLMFCLVYKNKYTLTCRLKPFHSFYVFVPSTPSIFLIIPLSTVKKDLSYVQGRRYFEVSMANLEKMRDAIITFIDFYEEVVSLDYKLRGFSKAMDQVSFDFDGFHIFKIRLLISGKNFILLILNNNEASEILSKVTEHSGLDQNLLHGIHNTIKLFCTPPFCQNFENQQVQISIQKHYIYIFSLIRYLMEKINLPLSAVSKMLNSCHNEEDNYMGSISLLMNVEKSRSERFSLSFEKNPKNIAELKTRFIMNGMQPTEISSFDDLLVLINQQNTYLSVF